MRRAIVTGLALTAALAASTAAQAQAKFNGTWSVEVVTEKGDCDKAYRYPVIAENGRLRYGGPEDFNVAGQVAANGNVSVRISRGSDGAQVRGRLDGKWGQGNWTTSGGRICSGRWLAEKRS